MRSWAVLRFFAIKKTPDVSLSSLCTEKGFEVSKILLLANMSIKFFFDLVPPCTDIPELLFNTTKSSLLSIIKSSFSLITIFVGL